MSDPQDDALARLTPTDLAQIVDEISRYDRSNELDEAGLAALVCCGELDEANLPLSAELAERLGVELQLIPQAGHVANLDSPGAFTDLLRRCDAARQ